MRLDRAKEYLAGAELAEENRLFNACALCCYAAMFWAAIAALAREGFKRDEWSHGGLRETFSMELIKKRNLYSPRFGQWLHDAYKLRIDAHYDLDGVSAKKARRMLNHVRDFLAKVEEVITR